MSLTISLLLQFIAIVFTSYLALLLLDFLIVHEYGKKDLEDNASSSARCFGGALSERRCHFQNICYKRDTDDFVFFSAPSSVVIGVPEDRFKPALAELSSVANHNQYFFNYIEVPTTEYARFSERFELRTVKHPTLIFGRFKPDNLMHLLHDDLLPLHRTANELHLTDKAFNVLFIDSWPNVTDASLGISGDLFQRLLPSAKVFHGHGFPTHSLTCFRDAYVGISRDILWYDYGFRAPQGPLHKSAHQEILLSQALRAATSSFYSVQDKTCISGSAVLISRDTTRLLLNENDIVKTLEEVIGLPVRKVILETLSLHQLLDVMRCTKFLIGVHGSALALSLFMAPGSGVVEIFPYAINPDNYTPYKTLAKAKNLIYKSWRNEDQGKSVAHPEFEADLGGISHLPADQQEKIKNSREVLPHLCCEDPSWLYRIYQDTLVDLQSFSATLEDVTHSVHNFKHSQKETSLLLPGPVLNSSCLRTTDSNLTVEISWQAPWNLEFVNDDTLKYEVLIQKPDSDSLEAHFTTSNSVRLDVSADSLIWIRCWVGLRKGPFQADSVIC